MKKPILTKDFEVHGTDSLLVATRAIMKLLLSDRHQLKEAKYKIDGKTITIKPRN